MDSEEKKWVRCLIMWCVGIGLITFTLGHWIGYNSGQRETTIALAHYLSEADADSDIDVEGIVITSLPFIDIDEKFEFTGSDYKVVGKPNEPERPLV